LPWYGSIGKTIEQEIKRRIPKEKIKSATGTQKNDEE